MDVNSYIWLLYITILISLSKNKQQISSMEFGKRMATEKELEKSEAYNFCNISKMIVISNGNDVISNDDIRGNDNDVISDDNVISKNVIIMFKV